MPTRLRSVLYGAAAGGFLAVVGLAVVGSRQSLGSVQGTLLDPATGRGRADFVISSGGLYLVVILVAVAAGLLIAGLVYAFGRENEPEGARFPLRYLLPTAALTSAVMAYAAVRAGLGAAATIDSGTITISAFRMIVVAATSGLIAGGATASVVDALARPAFIGFEGEAVPASPGVFMKEMMAAIGAPTIALVVAAVFAVTLSQLLLSLHGAAAVAAFSIAGAIVLGSAVLAAYRPWESRGG